MFRIAQHFSALLSIGQQCSALHSISQHCRALLIIAQHRSPLLTIEQHYSPLHSIAQHCWALNITQHYSDLLNIAQHCSMNNLCTEKHVQFYSQINSSLEVTPVNLCYIRTLYYTNLDINTNHFSPKTAGAKRWKLIGKSFPIGKAASSKFP